MAFSGKWTDSDKLAIALACLAAIVAIGIFWIEKTPFWAAGTIAVIAGLLVYPVVHFVPSGKGRIAVALVAGALLGLFGWRIWPPKPELHVAIPQPQTVQPPLKTPSSVAPPTPQDGANVKPPVDNAVESASEHKERLREVKDRVKKVQSQYIAEHPNASPQEIVDGVNAQLKALHMKSRIYLKDQSKAKIPDNLSQIESELLSQYDRTHPGDKFSGNTLSASAISYINQKLIARNIPWMITAPPGTPCTKNGIEIYSKEADVKNLHANGCFTGTAILINSDKLKLDGATVGGEDAKPQQ
jgi:hypothetical protein